MLTALYNSALFFFVLYFYYMQMPESTVLFSTGVIDLTKQSLSEMKVDISKYIFYLSCIVFAVNMLIKEYTNK